MNPEFLDLDDVLLMHRDQIERYGGDPGVRDYGLLESAIGMPRAGLEGQFLHTDLFHMAAAYLFHMVQNHPFVDGNKRTGLVAALIFLDLNGISIEASDDDLVTLVVAVASGRSSKDEIATFFRAHTLG